MVPPRAWYSRPLWLTRSRPFDPFDASPLRPGAARTNRSSSSAKVTIQKSEFSILDFYGHELSGAFGIHLEPGLAVGAVDQAAVRRAAVRRVEGDRREAIALVGFPFVHATVAVAVFFRRDQDAFVIVLDAGD